MSSALLDLDPTGTLSAVGAGVSLVAAALRLGTAAKKFHDSRGGGGNSGGGGGGGGARSASVSLGGPSSLHRSQTNPTEIPVAPKDLERERRAYETVNFVLREFGSRICAAGLVDEHALTKALMAATQHIEVNLFSGEANRLFESLAPKLADPVLVNSVFTSIYFIGALSAELSSSLPNYKDTYVPIGPRLVQQLFRAAIGEDAFRDNLTANLDAYKTLTTTAGLLRPTDIGYATFPRFPSLAPCRYSSRSFTDVRNSKNIYEKLVKHFERAGFPQPAPARQAEVGLIRDWRFLSGDSNSRAFDLDKADKNIGENFGRVLHWLICSAERLPPGQAVIAYYDQHIELIKWIQHRMGYAVLYPAVDLNLGGPHAQLERKLRMTIDSWVILMPSEAAQAAKRANAEHWMSTHVRTAGQAAPFMTPKVAAPQPVNIAAVPVSDTTSVVAQASSATNHGSAQMNYEPSTTAWDVPQAFSGAPQAHQPSRASSHSASIVSVSQSTNFGSTAVPTSPPMSSRSTPPRSPTAVEMPTQGDIQTIPKMIEQQVEEIDQHFRVALVPQFQVLWSHPSMDAGVRDSQCNILAHSTERETIDRLDKIQIPETHPTRMHRKRLIDQAQELMDFLPVYKDLGPTATHGRPLPGALQIHLQQTSTSGIAKPPRSQGPQSTGFLPPPYSPSAPPSHDPHNPTAAFPFPTTPKPTVIRRKAPPPPKKFVLAKGLYDFDPDPANEEELGFKEDDEIEIIEKTAAMEEDGWCRARVKGSKRIGLVPLEYLKIEEKRPTPNASPAPASAPSIPLSHDLPVSAVHVAHTASGETPVANAGQASAYHQSSVLTGSSLPLAQTTVNFSQPVNHDSPQSISPPSQPFPNKGDVSKLEIAGLTVSTIKAAACVGELVEGAHGLGGGHKYTQIAEATSQQQQQTSSINRNGHNMGRDRTNTGGDSQIDFGDQSNTSTNGQTTTVDENGGTGLAEDSPPMVDLSAFGEAPFDPQIPVAAPDQFYVPPETFTQQTMEADLPAASTTDCNETASMTDMVQNTGTTTFVDGPGPMTSPLASLALTSTAATTYTDITVTGSDETRSTFESFTDNQNLSTSDSGGDDYGLDE